MASINSLVMRVRSSLTEFPAPVWAHLSDIRPYFRCFGPRIRGFDLSCLVKFDTIASQPGHHLVTAFNKYFHRHRPGFHHWLAAHALERARRAKRAGARLHSRLVTLFAVIASVPAILVAYSRR